MEIEFDFDSDRVRIKNDDGRVDGRMDNVSHIQKWHKYVTALLEKACPGDIPSNVQVTAIDEGRATTEEY